MPRLAHELHQQCLTQEGVDFEMWMGVYKYDSRKQNINAAHRQIVEYAKLAEWPEVAIAEDDVKFFGEGAWQFFLDNKPITYDLYLSSIYVGDIKADSTVDYFCGFGLYIVHSRFYDTYLSVDKHEHIDRAMGGLGTFVVCQPFIAEQYDGHSQNTGKDETYGNLMKNRKIFGK